jgi:hypothetical protein
MYRDAWCKACVAKYCVDEESLKEYCMFNKRSFTDKLWVEANSYVIEKMRSNEEFNKETDPLVKGTMILDGAIKVYFGRMSMKCHYQFIDDLNEDEFNQLEQRKQEIQAISDNFSSDIKLNYNKKTYNTTWCGFYSDTETIYLDNYFEGLSKDHKIDNVSHVDYARKVCKASLAMDKAFSDMCEGKLNAEKRFKDMKDVFDSLSQSAKFAQKSRNEEDHALEFDSLGAIIKEMEYGGFLNKKVEFPKDDIDKIIEDFKWTLMSIGEEVT